MFIIQFMSSPIRDTHSYHLEDEGINDDISRAKVMKNAQ